MQPVWILTDERYVAQRMPGALTAALRRRAVDARLIVAERVAPHPAGGSPWPGLRRGDMVVGRARSPWALTLLRAAERVGAAAMMPSAAIEAVRDKALAAGVLADAGVPTPPTWLAHGPDAVRALPATAYPLLLKPVYGDNARGIRLVRGPDDLRGAHDEASVLVAQRYVDVAGVDLKLYIAGERVWAVRRPSPLTGEPGEGTDVPVDRTLHDLARRCAELFGLTFAGVDVLAAADGPLVVDVNDFPNYTGIAEAPAVLADLVLRSGAAAAPVREGMCA
ncbi:MAG TPA: ATP-grasp domain-containing protein [Egibacteraceae bacterium]|nr:ATP-grasp domain-containing protein [Egibacteraceae bacterium]